MKKKKNVILDISNGQYVENDKLTDEKEVEIRNRNKKICGPPE